MKITLKCKLIADTKNKIAAIEETMYQYNNITNTYFKILTKKHLGWSRRKLQVLLEQRKEVLKYHSGFSSALRQSARDKAIESYKSWVKTKGKKPKIKASVRLDKRTYRLIKTDNKRYPYFASITTKEGRVEFPLGIRKERLKYFGFKNRNAEIVNIDGQFYINIVFEVPINEIEKTNEVLGVDLGLINIATVIAEKSRKTRFFSGRAYNKRLMQLRGELRKAKSRKSKKLIGRKIKRVNNDIAHKISKKIAEIAVENKVKAIVFEDLRKLKSEKGKRIKKNNFRLSMWMRRKIQAYTAYKVGLNGVPVVTVDPLHTSQRCPRCNHTEKRNRKGSLFSCLNCGYKNNADRVGSINIAQRYLGVFVEHKFSADNMPCERLVADDTLEKEGRHEAHQLVGG
jgi:IS605 OrfB family transposase